MRKLQIRIICCLCRRQLWAWKAGWRGAATLYKQVLMADLNARLMAESCSRATAQQRHTYMGLHKILRLPESDGEVRSENWEVHWMLFNSAMRVAKLVVAVAMAVAVAVAVPVAAAGWMGVAGGRIVGVELLAVLLIAICLLACWQHLSEFHGICVSKQIQKVFVFFSFSFLPL